jgi:hypothetical protein
MQRPEVLNTGDVSSLGCIQTDARESLIPPQTANNEKNQRPSHESRHFLSAAATLSPCPWLAECAHRCHGIRQPEACSLTALG